MLGWLGKASLDKARLSCFDKTCTVINFPVNLANAKRAAIILLHIFSLIQKGPQIEFERQSYKSKCSIKIKLVPKSKTLSYFIIDFKILK
jgi:hypothetical protein